MYKSDLRQACGKLPGYMYLALGDPLQKRNYYRAGWLRFRDDTDMSATIGELSERKVYFVLRTHFVLVPNCACFAD
jgi:hypothetical protein